MVIDSSGHETESRPPEFGPPPAGPEPFPDHWQHSCARPEPPPISGQALENLWSPDASQARKPDNSCGILPGNFQSRTPKTRQGSSSWTPPDVIRALDHHKLSVAWMPVDNQGRKLLKLCKEKMFSVQRLDASQGLRREKLQNLYDYVVICCKSGRTVDIGRAAFTTSLNLISATLFSVDFAAFGSDSSQEFRDTIWGIMEIVRTPNFVDYFPLLRVDDPQGNLRKSTFYFKKCFGIFDEIINQRLQSQSDSMFKNDLLEALLEINQKNESELSFDDIKHLLLDLFVVGTDTTLGTVEWAMAKLVRDPEKMLKVRDELNNVIRENEQIQESDIAKFPYLQAVVKETFRLHPVVPLSLPHKADKDIEINGYVVPKDTDSCECVDNRQRFKCMAES